MIQILLVLQGPGQMAVQVHHEMPGGWLQVLKVLGAAVHVAAGEAAKPASSIMQPPPGLAL